MATNKSQRRKPRIGNANDIEARYEESQSILPSLMKMICLSDQLSPSDEQTILMGFMEQYSSKILIKLLVQGLQSNHDKQQSHEWISFFTEKMTNTLLVAAEQEDQNEAQISRAVSLHQSDLTLPNFDLELLTNICRFLDFEQVLHLQSCCRYLYESIANNPRSVLSLNKQRYFAHNIYHKGFHFITNLHGWRGIINTKMWFISILPNVIQFSVPNTNDIGIITDLCKSLRAVQVINFEGTTASQFQATFKAITHSALNNIQEINVAFLSNSYLQRSLDKIVGLPNLRKLSMQGRERNVSTQGRQRRHVAFENLTEFRFTGDAVNSAYGVRNQYQGQQMHWAQFIASMLSKCSNLRRLELLCMNNANGLHNAILGIPFGNIEALVLDTTSACTAIGQLCRTMSRSNMVLKTLHLPMWDKNMLLALPLKGGTMLNDLAALLETQMFRHQALKDLKFMFNVYDMDSIPIQLLFVMLVRLLNDDRVGRFHSMSIAFDMQVIDEMYMKQVYDYNKHMYIASDTFSHLVSTLLKALQSKTTYCLLSVAGLFSNSGSALTSFAKRLNVAKDGDWIIPLRTNDNCVQMMMANYITSNTTTPFVAICNTESKEEYDEKIVAQLVDLGYSRNECVKASQKCVNCHDVAQVMYELSQPMESDPETGHIDFKANDFKIAQVVNVERKMEDTKNVNWKRNMVNMARFHYPKLSNNEGMDTLLVCLEKEQHLKKFMDSIKSVIPAKVHTKEVRSEEQRKHDEALQRKMKQIDETYWSDSDSF